MGGPAEMSVEVTHRAPRHPQVPIHLVRSDHSWQPGTPNRALSAENSSHNVRMATHRDQLLSPWGFEQAQLESRHEGLGTIAGAEFVVELRDVGLGGGLADKELTRYLSHP